MMDDGPRFPSREQNEDRQVSMKANLAIPESNDDITVSWMQQALTAGVASAIPAVKDVVVEDIGAGVGMLGEVLRCHLTYEDGTAVAPETVIVKLPSSQPKNRRMSKRLSLYKREYDYYRHLAPNAPIRSSKLLYGDFEDGSQRFVLVLEDLRGMETTDELTGASAEQAKRAIRAVARLHGHFWNKVDRPPLSGLHDSTNPKNRLLVQSVYLAHLVPTLKHFGRIFSDEMRQLAEAYGSRVADHMSDLAVSPKTFIHGDFRLDNMFFGNGEDFAVIDWQVSGLAGGLYDVAYFLAGSVSSAVRREIEREALEEYHDIVCSMGAKDFALEACWRLYRSNILARLLISVLGCGGLDLTEERSRKLAEVSLRRTLTAIEDLEAGQFLPARRPFFSFANTFSTLSRGAYRVYKALR